MAKRRILITGGSGFIGTNVVGSFLRGGWNVLSLDIHRPRNADHEALFWRVDILDTDALREAVRDFQPEHVIHLAAQTGLDGKTPEAYPANTAGVENLILAISAVPSVRRCIFASTKLVCRNDYAPKSFEDYCPDTAYGQSKVISERLVKGGASLKCLWCIVRPTGIWGPWFSVPYLGFFLMVARGRYVHPSAANAPKSMGYVGNVVFQLEKLLAAPAERFAGRTFYISDYDPMFIDRWADMISLKLRGRAVRRVPQALMRIAARTGDILKRLGWSNPPVTSFRLKNMLADTSGISLDNIHAITGPLPYSMQQGVDETIAWLRSENLLA